MGTIALRSSETIERERHCESIQELLRVAAKPASCNKGNNRWAFDKSSDGTSRTSGLGVPTVGDVEECLRHGWADGLKKVRENIAALSVDKPQSVRRRRRRSDSGDEVDMQRVWSGRLEQAWQTTHREVSIENAKTMVTLMVAINGNSHMSEDSFFWRGAAAVVLADALERSGRRVEIVAFSLGNKRYHGDGYGDCTLDTVQVKEFEEPLDLERVTMALCMAGFFRVYNFRWILAEEQKAYSGLGSCRTLPAGLLDPESHGELMKHLPAKSTTVIVVDGITDKERAVAELGKLRAIFE